MNELFELFAEIAERYIDLMREPGRPPNQTALGAVADVLQERGYAVVTEKFLESLLSQRQGVAK